MKIIYFFRRSNGDQVSIEESFRPLIDEIAKDNEVVVYKVPCVGANPIKLIKNILFVRSHSIKDGINHITGDINYCAIGLLGRPSVVTIHDDYPIRQAHKGWLDMFYKWLLWIYLPVKCAKAPVCITPSTFKNIKHYCNSPKLRVITHHTIPSILIDTHKAFDKECPRFLQVGSQINKNLETSLKALKGMKCKLVVLKEMNRQQVGLANKYGIDFENRWCLPYEEVVKEYQMCDIVLFPSLYEGLGVPIFEGQAAGKPVITTNAEPMNWVAGDGAVLLNNPMDVEEMKCAISRLINDDDYRNEIVDRGIKNSKRFSLSQAVLNYMNLYKELLIH